MAPWLTGLACATALLLPVPGAAAVIVGDASMHLDVLCSAPAFVCPPQPPTTVTVPTTDPQVYQRLIHVPRDVAYGDSRVFLPYRPGQLEGVFTAAAMSAEHPVGMRGGVGVSGVFSNESLDALATFEQFVTNPRSVPVTVRLTARVPELTLLVYGDLDLDQPLGAGDHARASVDLVFGVQRATGALTQIFDYQARLEKRNLHNGLDSLELMLNEGLQQRVDGDPDIRQSVDVLAYPQAPTADDRIAGYRFEPFLQEFTLRLAPNEAVLLSYVMRASGSCSAATCDDGTGGVHATVGDPFGLQEAGPLFTLTALDPPPLPVPVPGPLLLLASAGLAVATGHLRSRRRPAGRTGPPDRPALSGPSAARPAPARRTTVPPSGHP